MNNILKITFCNIGPDLNINWKNKYNEKNVFPYKKQLKPKATGSFLNDIDMLHIY